MCSVSDVAYRRTKSQNCRKKISSERCENGHYHLINSKQNFHYRIRSACGTAGSLYTHIYTHTQIVWIVQHLRIKHDNNKRISNRIINESNAIVRKWQNMTHLHTHSHTYTFKFYVQCNISKSRNHITNIWCPRTSPFQCQLRRQFNDHTCKLNRSHISQNHFSKSKNWFVVVSVEAAAAAAVKLLKRLFRFSLAFVVVVVVGSLANIVSLRFLSHRLLSLYGQFAHIALADANNDYIFVFIFSEMCWTLLPRCTGVNRNVNTIEANTVPDHALRIYLYIYTLYIYMYIYSIHSIESVS